MKKLKYLSLSLCLLAGLTACTAQQDSAVQTGAQGTEWRWDKGTIVVETPERPAG